MVLSYKTNLLNNTTPNKKSQVKNSPKSPSLFKPFILTEEKLKMLAKKLMQEPLYLDDRKREYPMIYKSLFEGFNNKNNIFYEIGDFGGLGAFTNLIPSHKARISLKLWDKSLWGKTFVRQSRQLIKEIMNKYSLMRVETESPDPVMKKFAQIIGFKPEGEEGEKSAFKWENQFYPIFRLRILKEEI